MSGASGAFAVTVDTVAPAAPSTPDLAAASDSGSSDTDNYTSDTTPTLTGGAEAGATVTIKDGATVLGTALADGAGYRSSQLHRNCDGPSRKYERGLCRSSGDN